MGVLLKFESDLLMEEVGNYFAAAPRQKGRELFSLLVSSHTATECAHEIIIASTLAWTIA